MIPSLTVARSAPAPPAGLDPTRALAFIRRRWEEDVVPALVEYIGIPAKSPLFDPGWQEHGQLDRAVALVEDWWRARPGGRPRAGGVRLPRRPPRLPADRSVP